MFYQDIMPPIYSLQVTHVEHYDNIFVCSITAYQFEILWYASSSLIAQPHVEGCRSVSKLHSPLEICMCLLVLAKLHACHSQTILNATHHRVLCLSKVVCRLIQSLHQVRISLFDDLTPKLLNILGWMLMH